MVKFGGTCLSTKAFNSVAGSLGPGCLHLSQSSTEGLTPDISLLNSFVPYGSVSFYLTCVNSEMGIILVGGNACARNIISIRLLTLFFYF